MNEQWKIIENTSDKYLISSLGNLKIKKGNQYVPVKPSIDSCGYLYVKIKYNDKVKHEGVHRLVAKAFVPNPKSLPIVHHIDDDKHNNSMYNLFWCTHGQNNSFALYTKNGKRRGTRDIEQYDLEGNYLKSWTSFKEIYDELGMKYNSSLIQKCCRGVDNKKTAYGFIWKFGPKDKMYLPTNRNEMDDLPKLFREAYKKNPRRVKQMLMYIIENE